MKPHIDAIHEGAPCMYGCVHSTLLLYTCILLDVILREFFFYFLPSINLCTIITEEKIYPLYFSNFAEP